ncbi:MAG: 4a-hydroxytetrahydrobiopterin dehydratase, partial [Verrucomicrobiae bacterium]|nr:4a-hydroxytetrahydrobiopterin dehydratase [Verrucomicrobiae bacterium]
MTGENLTNEPSKLSKWQTVEEGSVSKLRKVFKFSNFAEALRFTNRVGELAEQEDHHPEILTEWGQVTISWWTHTTKGISPTDYSMA